MKVPEMEWMFHDVPSPEEEVIEREKEDELALMLRQSFDSLTPMEQKVIEALYLREEQPYQKDVAEELGITQGRVSQLEASALDRLKKELC
jgi:RNA polymerase sigma factor (sigma-70 family)